MKSVGWIFRRVSRFHWLKWNQSIEK